MNQVYDLNIGSEQGFQMYILDITVSSFVVKILLPYSAVYNGIEFRYYAFDDKRRKVISRLNQFSPANGIIKIAHPNPNFVVGISSVISLEYQSSFSYHLYVSQVTSTDCSITISISNTITQIGYQVLLGTKDAFYLYETVYATSIPSYVGAFNFESGWEDSQLLAVYQGISYQPHTTFRLRINRNNAVLTQTNYDIELWAGSVLESVYHKYGGIRAQWDSGYYQTFQLVKYFVSRNYDKNIASILDSFEFIIPELNFQTKIEGTFTFDISLSITDFTLIFNRKCEHGKKLIMQLIPKDDCSSTYYEYQINCESKFNICKQKLYFQTQTPLISKLKIEIVSDFSFKIQHNYIDQNEKFTYIANIQYV
ncbi:unnamed protein product (macronuclear) [Paramecium tetraurelia]|uniref:H-type lectin domain-containing protein n=1 Tax=Paramecium tetraurelia TaxID=5888 RepID=A0CAY3_PARTE|nr:uncharacterized protein GSPATT00036731001 [Paramecium tetraurelia]CAK67950.1 unnamed protein product [Paramecium tetraurelia]|eukprot:XP_001435347.1 hypothetical protein (macronuclear) [Paramecium tetraurelia strain d4-2]